MTQTINSVDAGGNDLRVSYIQLNAGVGTTGNHIFSDGIGTAPGSVTTTTTTITAANMLAGVFVNSNAAAVTVTLDTAANIVSAINGMTSGANVGDMIAFNLINGGSTSGAITVGAGTGGTFDANVATANKTIAINTQKTIYVRVTNVTAGSQAYVIYM